jgi:hypothetical protein
MRPSERLSPLELLEGIKAERDFVAEMEYAGAAAKSNPPHRQNRSYMCTQQDRNKATGRELEVASNLIPPRSSGLVCQASFRR